MQIERGATLWIAAVLALSACGGDDTPGDAPAEWAAPAAPSSTDRGAVGFTFAEVARESGLDFWHENGAFGQKWMPETLGSGGGFLDFDGDDRPDILLVNSATWPGHAEERPRATTRLFRNVGGGRFEDVTVAAGIDVSTYGMGAAFGDYDADGDPDIFITALGPNLLLRNDAGRFTDVTATVGLAGVPDGNEWSTAAAWVDVDRDGWIDLVVCDYVGWTPETDLFHSFDGVNKGYATPELYKGDTCRLYANRGGIRFEDRTLEAGLYDPDGKGLGIAVEDFDDDGWPDLAIANDVSANLLYRNRGDGTFESVGVRAGVAYDEAGMARAGMGIDVADLSGDGRLSIAIGNFSHEPVALFTEIGDWLFQDRAGAARLSRPSLLALTFGLAFADFDSDGALDLMLANGHIEPTIHAVEGQIDYAQRPLLFAGDREGRFTDVSDSLGSDFRNELVGRGLATSDYDRDGDLDVLVTTNAGAPRLFRNDRTEMERHWLRLRLIGRAPNTDALGAVVTVFAGGTRQRRMIRSGGSYLSASESNPVLVGLGERLVADSVRIRWPTSGSMQVLHSLAVDSTHVIAEAVDAGR